MTIEQLAIKVLSKLGVHDQGNPPKPEDLENVTDAYNAVYAVLLDDGLVTWANLPEADIPIRFSLSLITLVTAEIASFYSIPAPPEGWQKTKTLAVHQIRRQLASGQDTEPVESVYY